MRNVINHGMFVCDICEQELLDEKESEIDEGVCRACIGEDDSEEIETNDGDLCFDASGDFEDEPKDEDN